jgi:hypothetical protein
VYPDEAALRGLTWPSRRPISLLDLGERTMDAKNQPLSPLGLWILRAQREILLRQAAGGSAVSATDHIIVSPCRRKV